MKRLIVSDSSSNIYDFDGLDYRYVSLKVRAGNREFVDREGLNVEEMVNVVEKSSVTSTSCPNSQEWMEAFEGYDEIFAITITNRLSGSYASCVMARDEYLEEHPEVKIEIVDSLETGPGMVLIMEKLAELTNQGFSFEETVEKIHEYQKTTHLCFSLASIQNLAKNGRVTPVVAKLVGLFGIVLLGRASPEGTIDIVNRSRGEKKAIKAIYDEMVEMGYKGRKVAISHVLCPEKAEKVKALILENYPNASVNVHPCTGLCSYYAERGGMIIGYECN
ncbi:MAG: DegV family protein [Erysipelotrichaceae bacterium]|nr:DegV family protein [Erysipelotrichaceae bacterium]MBQ4251843.1 DegV family protein [Erysipelotrichaceae bacterium]